MPSDRSDSAFPITQRSQSLDTRGNHRIQAELKRLEQEARFLEVSSSLMFHVYFLFILLIYGKWESYSDDGIEITCQLFMIGGEIG